MTEKAERMLPPWALMVLSLAATYVGAAALCGYACWRRGFREKAAFLWGICLLSIFAFLGVSWWIDVPINLLRVLVSVFSLLGGVALLLWTRRITEKEEQTPVETTTVRVGWIALGCAAGGISYWFLTFGAGVLVAILLDFFLSTVFPMNASLMDTLGVVFVFSFHGIPAGILAGGILGYRFETHKKRSLLGLGAGVLFASVALATLGYCFVFVSNFQIWTLLEESMYGVQHAVVILLLFGAYVALGSVFLGRSEGVKDWLQRAGVMLFLGVCLTGTFSLYSRYIGYDWLLLGEVLDRMDWREAALRCYRRSLRCRPVEEVQSYLKYRTGVLYHVNEDPAKAREAFQAVVTKYDAHQDLVEKATLFLKHLDEAAPDSQRKVIQGVKGKTEYKANYCAPNSFARVYQYWGKDVTAKDVGWLFVEEDGGTWTIDALYHSVDMGFEVFVGVLMEIEDLKALVDANLPILVYIPGHVLVVFGYDEALDTLVVYDTAQSRIWVEYPVEKFREEWRKRFSPITLIVPREEIHRIPESHKERLASMTLPYRHYLLAMHKNECLPTCLQHLQMAWKSEKEFFFVPVTVEGWGSFLRERMLQEVDTERLGDAAFSYVTEEFEGEKFVRDLCDLLFRAGRTEQALEVLLSLEKKGDLPENLRNDLGMLEFAAGQSDEAAKRAEVLGEKAKPELQFAAARSYERLGDGASSRRFDARAMRKACAPYGRISANQVLRSSQTPSEKMYIRKELQQYVERSPYDLEACKALAEVLRLTGEEVDERYANRLERRIEAIGGTRHQDPQ